MLAPADGYRAAPTTLRLLAALLDLGVVAGAGVAIAWWWVPAEQWPPRYWNLLDYAVDIAWHRPDLLARAVLPGAILFVVWETLWGRLIGNTPVARLLGMRVVTSRGHRPGMVRLVFRTLIGILGAVVAFAGPLLAFVHPRRRMLHDMMTGCHVLIGMAPAEADSLDEDANALILEDATYRDGPFR